MNETNFSLETVKPQNLKPEILSPAGDMPAALAALAAGADAIYLGLKHFSARMQAGNFGVTELSRLCSLAHEEKRRIYIAFNTMLKPNDTASVYRLLRRAVLDASPDALILQDLGVVKLARDAGFTGELHFSTLSNVSHQNALIAAQKAGAARVILPRELSFEEVRAMGEVCPPDLDLELFVHGALCYCVSGRCWWSSYMGGKSGLRGRCVQPCRRKYTQKGRDGRFFSSLDLSLDTAVSKLLEVPAIRSWKIEGRKKGPHYVYHAVSAYRLLRDNPDDADAKKEASKLLAMAFGRPATKAMFLPSHGNTDSEEKAQSNKAKNLKQSKGKPTAITGGASRFGQTGSGLQCGRTERDEKGRCFVKPAIALLTKDLLRIGYEDEPWHATIPVVKNVAKDAVFELRVPAKKMPKNGTPVFLIDRKEPELQRELAVWEKRLERQALKQESKDEDIAALKAPSYSGDKNKEKSRKLNILLRSSLPQGRDAKRGIEPGTVQGLWLSPRTVNDISQTLFGRISWWLPPVIWPDEEQGWERLISIAVRKGARHFVCNEPWQTEFFTNPAVVKRHADKPVLTAGPLCNVANVPALALLKDMGFSSAIISAELGEKHILGLPKASPLPLGIVVAGYFPMGITRHVAEPVKNQLPFVSPMGEEFWIRRYGQSTWIYPSWPLDITMHKSALERAGYTTFVTMDDSPPKAVGEPRRTSEFNWNIDVL